MNINIIKNAKGLNDAILKNGCMLQTIQEESEYENISRQHIFLYNPADNDSVEIEPGIKKYNLIEINDIQYDSQYVYFTGISSDKNEENLISVYRYDYEKNSCVAIYEFNESLEKYSNYMRTRLFIVNEYYLFVQNEFLRANLTEDYEGYFDFELFMYNIKEEKKYKIYDEKLNQCGIMEFVPVTSNVCIIKTGFSLIPDNRYKILKKDEAVLESVSFVNIGQMVSDILIGQQNVIMDTIENVYYDSTIPYVQVHGNYICYSKVKLEEKFEEEIVFYNYAKKDSLMCINSKLDESMKLAKACVINERPYIIIEGIRGYEFIDIVEPENIVNLDKGYIIKNIEGSIIIATSQTKGLFGKQKNYIYAFKFPSMRMLHREKGQYEACVMSADGVLNIITE